MSAARKSKPQNHKDEVIHIRTAPSDKNLIERAADTLGLTISSFMLQNSIKAARRELADIEVASLSRKDALLFLSALTHIQKPNLALKSAYKSYEKNSKR